MISTISHEFFTTYFNELAFIQNPRDKKNPQELKQSDGKYKKTLHSIISQNTDHNR